MGSLCMLPRERVTPIRFLVLDCDGVLTDGGIWYSDSGSEQKRFHVRDGSGLKYWHRAGHASAILSGRESPVVERRARELGVGAVRLGAKEKAPVMEELMAEAGVSPEETAYMGDDLPDIPPMRLAGLRLAVADAVAEVRDFAHGVTEQSGGGGAVREAVESILKAQGRWDKLLARYFPDRDPERDG